jgi:DNA (cytosine-5)-methyltransferase 1
MSIKVLNLYAGIGGNRKYWQDVDVTAVEIEPNIAKIYQDFFPDDKVIITDAHQYLLEHYNEYDFIWSSPPCPSHSHIRKELAVEARGQNKPVYPDMQLYEEILLFKYNTFVISI